MDPKTENGSPTTRGTIKKRPGEGVGGGVPPLKGGNLFKRTLNHLTPRGLVGLHIIVRLLCWVMLIPVAIFAQGNLAQFFFLFKLT